MKFHVNIVLDGMRYKSVEGYATIEEAARVARAATERLNAVLEPGIRYELDGEPQVWRVDEVEGS